MPIYLATEPVQTIEAEKALITGGVVANSKAGYSGTGYVTGLDTVGRQCQFTFTNLVAGQYVVQFRYDTSAYRNLGFYVNGKSRGPLKLGKSEQTYATWTDISFLAWLGAGTNVIALRCDDAGVNVNLDRLSIALYSTEMVSGLTLTPVIGTSRGMKMGFDTVAGISYEWTWKANLGDGLAWQPLTNFNTTGSTMQMSLTNGLPGAYYRVRVLP